jgi:hypothetical protein
LLVAQPSPDAAVCVERVRLAAGPVQREHQLAGEALARRVLGHETLEPREVLDRTEPDLGEPLRLGSSREPRGELGERLSTPE